MDPILLEFAFGMLIGWATVTNRRLPRPIAWIAFPLGLAALVLTQALPESVDFSYRLVLWGVPGALLLLSTVALEAPCRKWFSGIPALLGDASYAIYLGHGFTVPLVGVLFLKLHLTSPIWMAITILLACLVSALAGIAVHLFFESPLTKRLNALRRRHSKTPITEARPN
jgi:peptidoglycan/LPS O-acetylase OafA/YrhL